VVGQLGDDLVAESVDVGNLVTVAVRHVEPRSADEVEDVLTSLRQVGTGQQIFDLVYEQIDVGDKISILTGDMEPCSLHGLAQTLEPFDQLSLPSQMIAVVHLELLRSGRTRGTRRRYAGRLGRHWRYEWSRR